MRNWAETTAAYRFLGNDEVSWGDVLTAHAHASRSRMKAHPVVLCLQDTTELDFNGQEINGLGPLSDEAQRELYLHPTCVVSPQGEPLGVFNAWTWAREAKPGEAPRGGVREGVRWVESYAQMAEQAREMRHASRVHRRPGVRHPGAVGQGARQGLRRPTAWYAASTTGRDPKAPGCGTR